MNKKSFKAMFCFLGILLFSQENYASSVKDRIKGWYKDFFVPKKERLHYLEIIKSLAPTLYEDIVEVDKTGRNHFKYVFFGVPTVSAGKDGLPIITLNPTDLKLFTEEELKFIFAHELCHYALKHTTENVFFAHKNIFSLEESWNMDYLREVLFPKGKNLPSLSTFLKSYSRQEEAEADRCAVMNLGVSVDVGISLFKKIINITDSKWYLPKDHSTKGPLFKQHPSYVRRIEFLENLRPEVELQRIHNPILPELNWRNLRWWYNPEQALADKWSYDDYQKTKRLAGFFGERKEDEVFLEKEPFSQEEHDHYMYLIKKIDHEVYESIKQFEKETANSSFCPRAFYKLISGVETVLIPKDSTYNYPQMIFKSVVGLSEKEQEAYLTPFVESYKALLGKEMIRHAVMGE